MCVGIVASILQQALSPDSQSRFTRELVYLAGIVHDMGKVLFEQYANEAFHEALKQARKRKTSSLAQESALIAMGHDEASGWLARCWKLGDPLLPNGAKT